MSLFRGKNAEISSRNVRRAVVLYTNAFVTTLKVIQLHKRRDIWCLRQLRSLAHFRDNESTQVSMIDLRERERRGAIENISHTRA